MWKDSLGLAHPPFIIPPASSFLVQLSFPNLSIPSLASYLKLSAISLQPPPPCLPLQTLWIFSCPSCSSNSRLAQLLQKAGRKQMLQGGHEATSTLRQVAQA